MNRGKLIAIIVTAFIAGAVALAIFLVATWQGRVVTIVMACIFVLNVPLYGTDDTLGQIMSRAVNSLP